MELLFFAIIVELHKTSCSTSFGLLKAKLFIGDGDRKEILSFDNRYVASG